MIRALTPQDLPAVLDLNNSAVPAVNALSGPRLAELVAASRAAPVVCAREEPDTVLGFALVFTPGAAYDSENYRWFSENSPGSLYVDRIVIDPHSRGTGLGPLLYEEIFSLAQTEELGNVTCEVNIEPPNPGSLAFHQRLGFRQLGTQSTKDGSVVVALLAAPSAPILAK